MIREQQIKARRNRAEWCGHIEAWERSGLAQSAYCNEHNLNPTSFSGWKTKLKERDEAMPFVEIMTRHQAPDNCDEIIELVLQGIRIRLREGIEPIRLRNIVIALAGV